MTTAYDHLLPAATKLVKGLSAKPGVHFADKTMVANWVAQVLHGMIIRGEILAPKGPATLTEPVDEATVVLVRAEAREIGLPKP